jgi:hypothetical protein
VSSSVCVCVCDYVCVCVCVCVFIKASSVGMSNAVIMLRLNNNLTSEVRMDVSISRHRKSPSMPV